MEKLRLELAFEAKLEKLQEQLEAKSAEVEPLKLQLAQATREREEAEALANQAKTSLSARYGEYCRCEWTPVAEDFEANSSNVLPSVVEGLIHYLSH